MISIDPIDKEIYLNDSVSSFSLDKSDIASFAKDYYGTFTIGDLNQVMLENWDLNQVSFSGSKKSNYVVKDGRVSLKDDNKFKG
jgi:hypothetical protein